MRSIRILLAFIFLPFVAVFAQWQSVGNVDSFSASDGEMTIHSGKSILQIRVLAPDLMRIRFATDGVFSSDQSYAVIKTNWVNVKSKVSETIDKITITTGNMSLVVSKKPLRLVFLDNKGNTINDDDPVNGMSWNRREVRVWKKMPVDESYYGFGEKSGKLNRRNTVMTMWNSDIPAYTADTDPLYESIPFFYGVRSGRAYGIFFDNPYWSSFDMGKESRDRYSFGAEGGELNYYFFSGLTPKIILERFTELVGRMPLPPRWSLGYQQCRWSYPTEQRVREIAQGFRTRSIPCDVIYLDIDYMDGYRIFTWNKQNFPDPKRMIADLSRDGFRIAVIVDPGIKADTAYPAFRTGLANNCFLKYPDGRTYIGKVWPGECAFPDFTNEAARKWWGENFSVLAQAGVRGWWNDMNEPSVFDVPTKTIDLDVIHNDNGLSTTHSKNHNVYGMQMTRATYDGVRKLVPGERPFVLTRASYAGGQRFSAAWTGDNVSSWEHLRMAVPMCLNLSISGQPFVGSDIGGFIGYPSGELFARWLQLGVFTPLMRAHSVINEKNKEPWEYGDEFTSINRETINLRYTLLPYIYDVMYEASMTGIPAMRPMAFEFPDDASLMSSEDEFMFGNDLLIAPVLWPDVTKREVRLPAGEWFNFWAGTKYAGGRNITVDAPVNRCPIFVKAGAIIPSQQLVQYSGQNPIDPLTLSVYPTSFQSTATYYEDDGLSFEYEKGKYFKRTINQWTSSLSITVAILKAEGSYVPARRSLVVRFVDVENVPVRVSVNQEVIAHLKTDQLASAKSGWAYDTVSKSLTVKMVDSMEEQSVVVSK